MDYKLTLSHHEIKGQRHGVRRFQNEDGSLTPAGRERYRKYVENMNREHPEMAGSGGGADLEEVEDDEIDDSDHKKKKKKRDTKRKVGGHNTKRKVGGHNTPKKYASFREEVSNERRRRLERDAEKKAQEAMKALDELNKETARGERLKRKRLGSQRRFNTEKPVNDHTYSMKEYADYIESGREYFKHMKRG